ncbi:hypothetical protein Bca52824_068946 [Brassica carinata]|uniref:GBF-interacting protein 1 N-terminal domain-containing protein n=1 Tax=Brassica carinata TaxID=52824 RepID=A0A8X7Q382_BRACI|nr:hypothetical protein Bca52824_068946 [Brassica carinata]
MGKSRASKKRAKDDVNAAAEVAIAKAVQRMQEIFSEHSEQEISAMLLECNMNQHFAVHRLLSKQDTSNEQGASTHLTDSSTTTTTTSSVLVPNQSDLPNVPVSSGEAVPLSSEPSSSAITNGETRGVPISTNEAVPSLSVPSSSDVTNGETRSLPISSGEAVPPLSVPSSSDITNGETRSETISSSAAAPSLPVPSTRAPTNVKIKRQVSRMISASDPSWADVFRGLHKKPDATNRSSNSLTEESDAARREPNPQHSAFPVNQSMDRRQQSTVTASLLGPRPPTSMADVDSFFSSAGFQKRSGSNSYTLAHDGSMMNLHYTWLEPDDTSIYQSLDSVFAPYRNSTLPLSATSTVPSSHGSAYDFGNAANSSGNAANSRLWSGSIPRVHLPSDSSGGASSIDPSWHVNGSNSRLGYGDDLPPVHLQGSRSSNEWTVQSEESYFIPSHWRLPGYIPSQQEREAYRSLGYERLRAYNASLNQENSTSDPSDQTKQRPGDK